MEGDVWEKHLEGREGTNHVRYLVPSLQPCTSSYGELRTVCVKNICVFVHKNFFVDIFVACVYYFG